MSTERHWWKEGWWGMACWNALGPAQQVRLIEVGNLPMGYIPNGKCRNVAVLEIETRFDESPGPRFYCLECVIEYLQEMAKKHPRCDN